jgi:hypothetical protein
LFRPDLILSGSDWCTLIVGRISPSINVDSRQVIGLVQNLKNTDFENIFPSAGTFFFANRCLDFRKYWFSSLPGRFCNNQEGENTEKKVHIIEECG